VAFDITGAYSQVFGLFVVLSVVSAALVLASKPPT
jgi:hypothetical protein